jgi:hypothetical protein
MDLYTCPACGTAQTLVGGQRFCAVCRAAVPDAVVVPVAAVAAPPPAGSRWATWGQQHPLPVVLLTLRHLGGAVLGVWLLLGLLGQLGPQLVPHEAHVSLQANGPPIALTYGVYQDPPGIWTARLLIGGGGILWIGLLLLTAWNLWDGQRLGWRLVVGVALLDAGVNAAGLLLDPVSRGAALGSLIADGLVLLYLARPTTRAAFA